MKLCMSPAIFEKRCVDMTNVGECMAVGYNSTAISDFLGFLHCSIFVRNPNILASQRQHTVVYGGCDMRWRF